MRSVVSGILGATLFLCAAGIVQAADGWYTEGDNVHTTRIKLTIVNTLDIDRQTIFPD